MRVLIVDDDAAVRRVARAMLERAGHEASEAADGDEGVRAFLRDGADVILCDVFMPEAGGLHLLQELRREGAGARVVAMSGCGSSGKLDLLPLARRLGASAALYKPFTAAELEAALAGACGGGRNDAREPLQGDSPSGRAGSSTVAYAPRGDPAPSGAAPGPDEILAVPYPALCKGSFVGREAAADALRQTVTPAISLSGLIRRGTVRTRPISEEVRFVEA